MAWERGLYCIEDVHDSIDWDADWTVEPMLELLQGMGYWDYKHRTCSTTRELQYRLEDEWLWFGKGSVLYFNLDGFDDEIVLSSDEEVRFETLKEWIGDCRGCHVHFGGFRTLYESFEDNAHLQDLLDHTGATSVSGYSEFVKPLDRDAPTLASDLLLLAQLRDNVNLARNDKFRPERLKAIEENLRVRFPKCGFQMLVAPYKPSRREARRPNARRSGTTSKSGAPPPQEQNRANAESPDS